MVMLFEDLKLSHNVRHQFCMSYFRVWVFPIYLDCSLDSVVLSNNCLFEDSSISSRVISAVSEQYSTR